MSDYHKPNRKKAQTDSRLNLHYLWSQQQTDSLVSVSASDNMECESTGPSRTESMSSIHGAFFTPQRPRHDDSFVEPRRNYGLPSISHVERS